MELQEESALGADELLGRRLRDLILRFPSGLLEGVRWSVLRKVYADRFPDGPHIGSDSMQMAARVWLVDVAKPAEEGAPDSCFHLHDAVAMRKGVDGQLACWPLLVKTLAGIVRLHGSPQAPREANAGDVAEEGWAGGDAGKDSEVLGVLLSQLKPLLMRHWDPNFQERAVGYFNEDGCYISVRKMKHLVAALLEWRARRHACMGTSAASAVDAALEAAPPLLLRTSQRHNDMVLCCPRAKPNEQPAVALPAAPGRPRLGASLAPPAPAPRVATAAPGAAPVLPAALARAVPSPAMPARAAATPTKGGGELVEDSPLLEQREASPPTHNGENGTSASTLSPSSPRRPGEAQRLDMLEKESRRLRIENAELKKRLRFDSEFLHKQIRRLRIENAELKKRVFFSSHHLAASSRGTPCHMPHLPLQPVWVPASAAVFTPVVAGPGTAPSGAAPSESPTGSSVVSAQQMGGGLPASGQVSPAQGSLTPVPHAHGFCYAVPLTQGVMSPVGQPWPSALGHLVAVPIGAAAAAAGSTAVMSPFSDRSQQERLLPKSLLGSSHAASSSNLSDVVSPEYGGEADGTAVPCVHFAGTDDRWVCIPSGIVERHKAQFEAPGAGDGPAEAPAAASGEPLGAAAAAAAASSPGAWSEAGSLAGDRELRR